MKTQREIKFRAWAHASKKMFYPDSEHGWVLGIGELNPLPNTSLMQFTGLHDKNGAPIYEGDILRVLMPTEYGIKEKICPVGYAAQLAGFTLKIDNEIESLGIVNLALKSSPSEVIGNVFETPDLLNNPS